MSNMNFYFKVSGDKLSLTNLKKSGVTGNVNSYKCIFELSEDWDGFYTCAVFAGLHETFTKVLLNNECIFPAELLDKGGIVRVGLFGTKTDEEQVQRLATSFVDVKIVQGCEAKGNIPEEPTAEEWEILISKSLPTIGENGNWYFWDIGRGEYIDSGCTSRAKDITQKTITASTEITIEPNVVYDLGAISDSFTVTLAEPSDTTVVNEYMFEFTTVATNLKMNFTSDVGWIEKPKLLIGKRYQCSIMNNIGIIAGVDI